MTRAELQLAVGAAAVVGDELPPLGALRRFAARGPGDHPVGSASRVVLVHPLPPGGPARGRMLERMAAISAIRHAGLVAPLACGNHDEGTWVVEALPGTATLADRVAETGPLSVQETVRIIRESARAMSALHRGGMTHGALVPEAIACPAGSVLLHRLGHAEGGSVSEDLHALGRAGWFALTGRAWQPADRSPRTVRQSVPEELDRVIAGLLEQDPASRIASGEAVLEALDWFPVREATPLRTLIDGAGRGARLPNERRAAITLALVGLALLLSWLLAGRGAS